MADTILIDDDTKEILDTFIPEAIDLLDHVDNQLNRVADENWDEIVNSIFRSFHSIKGTSGALNLKQVHELTHISENLLDVYRKERLSPRPDVLDLLEQVSELLREMIYEVGATFDDSMFADSSAVLCRQLSSIISGLSGKTVQTALRREILGQISRLDQELKEFSGSESEPSAIQELINRVRLLKSDLDESFPEEIRRKIGEFSELIIPARENPDLLNEHSLQFFDSLLKELEQAVGAFFDREEHLQPKKLGEILVEQGVVANEDIDTALDNQAKPLGTLLVESGAATDENIQDALNVQQNQSREFRYQESRRKDIRVATEKLDRLFDLTGELITTESIIRHNPDLNESQFSDLKRAVKHLEKVSNELQDIVMSVRMVPLDGLFIRMKRLVKDLVGKTGKKTDLVIFGSETEMDRNIIEEIVDPLVHIIRNALDHGIESPEERIKEEKSESGRLELKAKYEGNEIWISLKDDGRGIDPEVIRRKAEEKGLIKPGQTADRDLLQLIFEPGFSTEENVSSLSGRGVGMDVVKRNIEKLNGQVDIQSITGKGTEIVMKIPLTLAITSATLIQVGSKKYALPLFNTRRFIKPRAKDIIRAEGREMIKVNGEVLPIIRLDQYYGVHSEVEDICKGVFIMVENNRQRVCLFADAIIGYQQIVIKSLTDYIEDTRGFSGCSILGDGKICLIVDAGYIIKDELG